jgi:hypothetical protein
MLHVENGSFRTARIDLQGWRKKCERCGYIMILDLEIRPKRRAERKKNGRSLRGEDDSHRESEFMSIEGSSEGKRVRKSARKESG